MIDNHSAIWAGGPTAIVVVDVQNDFVEGGALGVTGGRQVANDVLQIAKYASPLMFFTKDWHIDPGPHFSDEPDYLDSWPRHCVAETDGAEFARPFVVQDGHLFLKGQYEASYSGADGVNSEGRGLIDVLTAHGIKNVEVLGIAFDYCVKATAIDLARAGFGVAIPYSTGWTASVHPDNDPATIDELTAAGVSVR